MVVTRDPSGRINDRAYFSTDVDASVEAILEQFARRWEIEVAFRNTKQAMGFQDPQNGWWRRANSTPRPKKNALVRIHKAASEKKRSSTRWRPPSSPTHSPCCGISSTATPRRMWQE